MISHSHRCIFIHIPKTGGTSIESLIWPGERSEGELWMGFVDRFHNRYQTGGLQHLLARQIRDHVGVATFSDYFKFAIVRDPWGKAVSQFNYMAQRADLCEFAGLPWPPPDFKAYLAAIARKEHVQWMAQHRFVVDDNGELLTDFLGRYESLSEAAATVFERLGLRGVSLPHLNRSLRRREEVVMDAEARDMVATLYAEDIRRFAYRAPPPDTGVAT